MKKIISILMLACLMINSNSILAFAMTNNEEATVNTASISQHAPKKQYNPNTQEYTAEDGTKRTIYWAQGITPPQMTNDESLRGTDGYFEKETINSSTGKHEVYQYPYEPGHGYYDLNKNTYRMGVESHLCYFGSALNLLYWWFDQNSEYIAEYTNRLQNTNIYSQPAGLKKILPYDSQLWSDMLAQPSINYVQDVGYSQEIGTSLLAKRALSYYFTRDKGFFTDAVVDYFINGYPCANESDGTLANKPEEYVMDNTGGYFYPIFDKQMITERYQDGQASQYSFYNDNMAKFFNEGKGVGIAYRIGGATLAHAITVWGAEYDSKGNLVRFYVTDTDDYQYQTIMKPDTLRGMHSMNVYPSSDGLMLMGNNVDNKNDGARVYYLATVSLEQDKWESRLADTAPPQKANITTQPADELYPLGAQHRNTKVIAEPTDNSFLTYQWYECDSNGNNPKKLRGQTTDTLKPDITQIGNKYYYCDVITNKNGHELSTKTRVVKITVDDTIELTNAQTPNVSFNTAGRICQLNDDITLSVNAWVDDGGTLTYQWYESNDSSGNNRWILKGETNSTFKPSTAVSNKRFYLCEVTNTNNTVTGTRIVKKSTMAKMITVAASDKTALQSIVSTIEAVNRNDYSPQSYQNMQDYYNVYSKYLTNNKYTQREIDEATSELIIAYEGLVPYFSLDLVYENEGTVNVKYGNINNQEKSHSILFGNNVTLTANANSGYEFIGWYETVTKRIFSTDPTYTFQITSNLNIEPKFKKVGTSSLIFTNRTGQYIDTINKSNSSWNSINSISSILPKVPFSYGYTNGKWVYNEAQVLNSLRNGNDVVLSPIYDKAQIELPTIPEPTMTTPKLELHYEYNSSSRIGSFIMASGIPSGCRIISSGIVFSLGEKDAFDPTSIVLNLNNKMLVSQFAGSYEEPLNVVNLLRLDSKHNVAAKGYMTYYDNYGNLKTVYSNQVNIINCAQV